MGGPEPWDIDGIAVRGSRHTNDQIVIAEAVESLASGYLPGNVGIYGGLSIHALGQHSNKIPLTYWMSRECLLE